MSRLCVAPNRGILAAKNYKWKIDNRLKKKLDNFKPIKEGKDAHYKFALMKYLTQFSSLFSGNIILLSCDDKSKIFIGLPEVSKYFRNNKYYFKNNNAP